MKLFICFLCSACLLVLFSANALAEEQKSTEGTLKWSYTTGENWVSSSPAIGPDGTIYVGSDDRKLYAVTPTGTLKWSYTTGNNVMSSPAVGSDGTIYVGSADNKLYAVTPDGTLKWSYTTGNQVSSSPAIGSNGTIYVGSSDNKLYAVNRWSYTTGDQVYASSPAIGSDGTIYVGSWDYKLYAVTPTGALKWSYTTGDKIWSSPAIGTDGTIYVGSGDNKLYAVTPTGTLKWSYATGGQIYSSSPAIGTDGTIYVGSGDKRIYAITPTGTSKWSYATGGGVHSSPAIGTDGTIYVGSLDGKLYALTSTGTLKWSYTTGGGVYSSPAIGTDGTIYVGSYDGKLYALTSSSTGGLASSPWPMFHHDNQHTGKTGTTITSPSIPILLFPINGSTGISTSPTLLWNKSDVAKSYTLQVSQNNNFSSFVFNQAGTDTSKQITALSEGITYYWRVNALNSDTTSEWSSTWSFTTQVSPPPTPALLSPASGATNISTSPTLSWNGSGTATSYTLQVSQSSDMSNPIYNQSVGNVTSQQVTGLSNGMIYYWRVNASNAGGTSAWSGIWSFTTQVSAPSSPVLTSPSNGSTGIATAPMLSWASSSGANSYTLQVSQNSNLSNPVFNQSVGNVTSKEITGLAEGTVYYWRVNASNTAGTSDWSTTWNFTTALSPPPAPSLKSPSNGATGISTSPLLEWNASAGATAYTVQVSQSSNFSGFVFNQSLTDTSKQITGLSSGMTYYWRVSAFNPDRSSGWSNTWSFTTLLPAPLPPVLSSPINGATGVSESPLLRWNKVTGATSYTLQLSLNSNFSNFILNNVVTDTSMQVNGLTNGVTYYWRVNAINPDRSSGWSLTWNFKTISSALIPPVLLSPDNGAQEVTASPLLKWNKVNGATSYTLQVSQNNNFSSFVFNQVVTDTSKQISGLSVGITYYWRVNAFNTERSSGWSYTWNFTTKDGTPPSISSVNAGDAVIGQDKTVTCSVTDNILVQSVKLYYRQGGGSSFISIDMTKQSGSTYSGTIPSTAVTTKGVDYYIESIDNVGNKKTYPDSNPTISPQVIRVTIGSSGITRPSTEVPSIPSGKTSNDARMISIPLDLSDKNLLSLFGSAFESSTYDKKIWRIFRYSGSSLLEYPSITDISPGQAFWIMLKNANPTIKAANGVTVSTANNFTMDIPSGWSQIGNPFNFPVSWKDIRDSTGVSNLDSRIWKFTETGYSLTVNALIPWEGYFIKNTTNGNVTLKIPPKEYSGLAKEGDLIESICPPDGWMIQIKAQNEDVKDEYNFAGVSPTASPEFDQHDFSEPPPFGDYISLYFPHDEWKERAGNYAGDFRPLVEDGVTWDFIVESSTKEDIELQCDNFNDVPQELKIMLIDPERSKLIDLRSENKYSFTTFYGKGDNEITKRKFKLVVGSDAYVEKATQDIPKLPEKYVLEQNYPNPFNPTTTMRFAVPQDGRVTIEIFNILGQHVATVIDENLRAGRYEVKWDGRNDMGQPVASGMYLYQMRAGKNFVQTKKLLLLR